MAARCDGQCICSARLSALPGVFFIFGNRIINETNGGLNVARHKKCRQIGFTPRMLDFSPSVRTKFEIILNIDELEALRLTDSMKLDQTQAGIAMGVSRGTLQRILNSAHEKVADALLNGKKIRIVSDNTYHECNA